MNSKTQTRRQKGFIILTGGMMLTFTIPIVGLAIDAGFLFAIKARLQSASDAAALAAARSLAVGLTIPEQEANAIARANAFYRANFPDGMMNTTTTVPAVYIAETAFRTRTVTVTSSAQAPLFFMRIFNSTGRTTIAAMGKASRRDVNVILVLDRSGSMNNNGGCPAMRAAAKGFVDLFANQRDRLGMITYGISYALTYAPTMNFKTGSPSLPTTIDTITCGGGTGAAQGLYKGYEQILNINEPGALNVIIFFTDGIPNTITANFPINRLDTTRNADGGPNGVNVPQSDKTSRCYDYQNGKRWYKNTSPTAPGVRWSLWQPTTEVIRGALYAQEGMSVTGNLLQGVTPYVASGFSDPSGTVPELYLTSTDTVAQNNSSFNNDCWFRGGNGHNGSGQGTGTSHIQYDIAYLPSTDLYGTSLTSPDNFRTVNKYSQSHVYANQISVNDTTNMMNATIVALDNMGSRVRNNALASNINTVVYTIGLADVAAVSYGHTLLKRVANDPTSPIYDPNRLTGMYTYAPTAADLNAAFVRIAAEILRIAQ